MKKAGISVVAGLFAIFNSRTNYSCIAPPKPTPAFKSI